MSHADLTRPRHDYQELKSYLEGYVQAETKRLMSDDDFVNDPEIQWSEWDARVNACERLQNSIEIMFARELIKIEID